MRIILAVVLFLAGSGAAWAQSCFQGQVSQVAFGQVGPAGGSATGSIGVTCQKNWTPSPSPTYFRLCLYIPGGTPISSLNPRRMSNYNNGEMTYDLFTNASRSQKIGNGAPDRIYSTTLYLQDAGVQQTAISFPVHGWVYPQQSLPAGNYQSQNYATVRWVSSATSFPPESACGGGNTIAGIYLGVSATWENSCAVLSLNDMSFGSHTNVSSVRDSQTGLSIQCPVGTAWQVALGNGNNFSTTRRMRNSVSNTFIPYGLFQNAARTTPWGNTSGSNTMTGTGTGASQNLTIYGRVPAQGTTPAGGRYEDNVVMQLIY